jgi:hypothetical protein
MFYKKKKRSGDGGTVNKKLKIVRYRPYWQRPNTDFDVTKIRYAYVVIKLPWKHCFYVTVSEYA